jgi:hypothetical protein
VGYDLPWPGRKFPHFTAHGTTAQSIFYISPMILALTLSINRGGCINAMQQIFTKELHISG